MSRASTRRVRRQWLARTMFVLWVPCVLVPCAYFLAGHLLTLPEPEHEALERALTQALREQPVETGLVAIHVLYSACGCSQRVLRLLERRPPDTEVEEWVWVVEPELGQLDAVRAAGFRARGISRAELVERFHVEAAPLFIVAEASGALRYVGGYTDRKRGPEIRDLDLMAAVGRGETPAPLPLFGCATSTRLQARIDPLGLK